MEKKSTILYPRPPFDFALTAAYQTYYRGISGADLFIDGIYSRLLDVDGQLVLVRIRDQGIVEAPELLVEICGDHLTDAVRQKVLETVQWIFGLDIDLHGFYALAKTDPLIAKLVGPFWGLRPPRTATVFEALVLAILGQQIAGAVAWRLRRLIVEELGPALTVDGTVYHAFPSPAILAAAGPERLRALKLPTRKALYLSTIAARIAEGSLTLEDLREASNADVAERLLPLRGVGRWTVEWVLARALGRTDAFPADDLALQRALARLLLGKERRLTAAEATAISERWGPYKGLVTTYLFAAIRTGMV